MGFCNNPCPVSAAGTGISVLSCEAEDGLCSSQTNDAFPPAGTCDTASRPSSTRTVLTGVAWRVGGTPGSGPRAAGWSGRGGRGDIRVPATGQPAKQVAAASPAARVATMRAHSLSVDDTGRRGRRLGNTTGCSPAEPVHDRQAERGCWALVAVSSGLARIARFRRRPLAGTHPSQADRAKVRWDGGLESAQPTRGRFWLFGCGQGNKRATTDRTTPGARYSSLPGPALTS